MENKFIEDLSPVEGIYSNFILLKDKSLVSLIRIKGINFDLLSVSQQNTLFQEYEAFLAQNAHYNLQIVSMTMPVQINNYLRKWKKEYIKSINSYDVTENLKQLKASYLYDFQKKETALEMNQKQHFIVVKEKIKKNTIADLKIAEKKLKEKAEEVKRSLSSFFGQFDCDQEIVTAYEILNILRKFLDYQNTAYGKL